MESTFRVAADREEMNQASLEEAVESQERDLERQRETMILKKIDEYITEVFDAIRISERPEENAIHSLIDIVTARSWPLEFSRKTITAISKHIFSLEASKAKLLAKLVIDLLQTNASKFDHQLTYIREKLSAIFKSEKEFSEAAALLVLNTSLFCREEYLNNHKLSDCMKIASLCIEAKDWPKSMLYLNKLWNLRTNETSTYMQLRIRFLKSKFFHQNGHIFQAAHGYVKVSRYRFFSLEDRLEALNNALSCMISAKEDLNLSSDSRVQWFWRLIEKISRSTGRLKYDMTCELFLVDAEQTEKDGQDYLTRLIVKIKNFVNLELWKRLNRTSDGIDDLSGRICDIYGIISISENEDEDNGGNESDIFSENEDEENGENELGSSSENEDEEDDYDESLFSYNLLVPSHLGSLIRNEASGESDDDSDDDSDEDSDEESYNEFR